MTTMTRYPAATMAPEIFAWLESAMPFSGWRSVPVEEYSDERGYVLRAELPDRNPEKDISVTVADGALTIAAKREQPSTRASRANSATAACPARSHCPPASGGRGERELQQWNPGDPCADREVLDAAPGAGFVHRQEVVG